MILCGKDDFMRELLITVIVPIYNVEKYINKCIESIKKQTYKNLEIILVDDGSTDRCGEICDNYSKKDNRIIVIHKENGGLSDARNTGVDWAKGEYITFVDSDDYLDKNYIEKLYRAIKKDNTEISQCGIIKFNEELKETQYIGYSENNIITTKQSIIDMSKEHWVENVVVWNKMYSKELIKDIKFAKGMLHEDEFFTYKALYNSDKISIIKDYLYYYRQNSQSIMGKKYDLKRLDILEAFNERIDFFKSRREEELYNYSLLRFLDVIKLCYCNVKQYYNSEVELLKKLRVKYKEIYKEIIKIKNISVKSKMKKYFFYRMPNLYYKVWYRDNFKIKRNIMKVENREWKKT